MNKIVFLLLIGSLLSLNMGFAALDDEQVLYWSFDDDNLSGGLPLDLTGNGYNAASNTGTTGQVGIINESFDYDGSSEFTERAAIELLNVSGDNSYSVWFNADTITTLQDCQFSHIGGVNDRITLCFWNTTKDLTALIYDGQAYQTSTSFNNTGDWQHAVVTWDSDNKNISLYLNGSLTVDTGSVGFFTTDTGLHVGAGRNTEKFFDGRIDEFGAWNRTLSSAEVTQLYNSGAGCQYPYTDCPATPPTPAQGPIPQFLVTASDLYNGTSIQDFNVTINNPITYTETSVSGTTNISAFDTFTPLLYSREQIINGNITYNISDEAVNMSNDGVGSDAGFFQYNNLTNDPLQFNGSNNLTISVWFKANPTTTRTILSSRQNGGSFEGYTVEYGSTGRINAKMDQGASVITCLGDLGIANGQWRNFMFEINGEADTIRLYSKGDSSPDCTVSITTPADFTGSYPFYLGTSQAGSLTSGYVGSFALIQAYDGVLTSAERTNVYNNQTLDTHNLVFYQSFSAVNLTVQNVTVQTPQYFNRTYKNYSANESLAAELTQARAYFQARTVLSNVSVNDFTAQVFTPFPASNTAATPSLNLSADTYTAQFNKSGFFDENISINVAALTTNTYLFSVGNAQINLTARDYFSNNTISNFSGWIANTNLSYNQTFNTTTGLAQINAEQNNYTVFIESDGYQNTTFNTFDIEVEEQFTEFNTTLVPFTEIYARANNLSMINTFKINYSGTTYTTTNGLVQIPLFNDSTANVTIFDATDGTVFYASDSVLLNASPALENYTFELALTNSIQFRFLNEQTNELINDTTINAFLTGELISYNYTTTTGLINDSLIVPQTYVITYNAPEYIQREYFFDLTNQSNNVIDLYLLNSTTGSVITAEVVDELGSLVDGARIVLQKKNLSGTNYYVVEMCETSLNGECLLSAVLQTTTYRAIVTKDQAQNIIDDFKFTSTDVTFRINLGVDALETVNDIINLDYSFTSTSSNVSSIFTLTYSDSQMVIVEGCVRVRGRLGVVWSTLNDTCNSGSTGTVIVSASHGSFNELEATAYVSYDGTNIFTLKRIPLFISQVLDTQDRQEFLFVVSIISLGFLMSALLFGPLAGVLVPLAPGVFFLVMHLIGFVFIPLQAIVGLLLLGVIIAVLARRR